MRSRSLLAAGAALAFVTGVRALRGRRKLRGAVVLITGASRGLGLVLARAFARRGAKLAICARDVAEVEAARVQLEQAGADVLALVGDVSNREAVEVLVGKALGRFGRIDVLVANAGVIDVGPAQAMTLDDYERSMAVNFWGAVYPTLAVLPAMRARGDGAIVHVTSIGGKVAVPHLLPYDCAKFALVGFSEGLSAEIARDGVRVTTVVPGLMRTGSPVNAFFRGDANAEMTWFTAGDATPLTAMHAARAAERIVRAVERGETEVTLGWQATLLRATHGLLPQLVIRALRLVERLLPRDESTLRVRGRDVDAGPAAARVRAMVDANARDNNEYAGA